MQILSSSPRAMAEKPSIENFILWSPGGVLAMLIAYWHINKKAKYSAIDDQIIFILCNYKFLIY